MSPVLRKPLPRRQHVNLGSLHGEDAVGPMIWSAIQWAGKNQKSHALIALLLGCIDLIVSSRNSCIRISYHSCGSIINHSFVSIINHSCDVCCLQPPQLHRPWLRQLHRPWLWNLHRPWQLHRLCYRLFLNAILAN